MILSVLGSAASEGVPSLFCTCPTCEEARRNPDGPDYRRRTAYLLDEDTLIDFGPDLREQMRLFQIDFSKIRRIVLTHAHGDHLDGDNLCRRGAPFAVNPPWVDFYSDEPGLRIVGGVDGSLFERVHFHPQPIHPGDCLTASDHALEIFAVRATHDPSSGPLNYFFTRGGKTLLLANDTAWWPEETWRLVAEQHPAIDCVVIDCCGGIVHKDWCETTFHMGADGLLKFREKLISLGLMTDRTPVYANHFSHNGGCGQKNLEDYLVPRGVSVAHDGLRIII